MRPHTLLRAIAAAFKPGDALLLGTDLKKDAATLELAYNDPTGVTAAFNKNLLARINRELGGHFDLDAFEHVARYDAERGAVDSFLSAQRGMTVAIDALGMEVRLIGGGNDSHGIVVQIQRTRYRTYGCRSRLPRSAALDGRCGAFRRVAFDNRLILR